MYSRMQDGGGGFEPLRVPKQYDGTALRKSEDLPLCEEKKECEISPPCGQDSPFRLPFLRSSWLSQILNSDLLLLLLAFLLLSDGDDCRAEEDLPLLLLLLLFIK